MLSKSFAPIHRHLKTIFIAVLLCIWLFPAEDRNDFLVQL